MRKAADRVASLRCDPALQLEKNPFAGGNGKVLSRTKDAFGNKCKERRIKPGHLMLVGNDQGERWAMVMKITGYVVDVVDGQQVVRDELVCEGFNCWSVAHLLKAIAEGKVLNADLFGPQIAGLARDVNFLAYNHTSVVHAEQVITGITEGEMDKVAAVHPKFFLQIGDGKVTDWEDPYKAHEFVLVSRDDLPR